MAEDQLKQIDSMTNVELRAELKRRGCSTTGIKKDLLAKLRAAIKQESKEKASLNHSVDNTQDEMSAKNSRLSVQDQKLNDSSFTTETPEEETQASDNQSSINGASNETANTTSIQQVLDTSINDNNVEVKSFVSKSIEEEQRNIEKLGGEQVEESYPSSVGSISAKSESIVKETQLSDEQQRSDQSNSEQQKQNNQVTKIDEESKSAAPATDCDAKNTNEVADQHPASDKLPADLNAATAQEQKPTTDESSTIEKAASQQGQKTYRSQTSSSFMKGLHRSTNNKINLSSELLQTFISDISLLPASVANEELDAWIEEQNVDNYNNNEKSMDESVLETNTINDLLSDSMTIGDLADQKQQVNRTVVMNVTMNPSSLNDDSVTRKKSNSTMSHVPGFESKVSSDEKTNTVVTDEPIRMKNLTAGDEPSSQILYIRGLTRPFTLLQLKSLLSRYGALVDGQFWLNKIKSECLATYNTVEEAQNARESLDGCRWPSTNPKILSIRFAQQNELEFSQANDLSPDQMTNNKHSVHRTIGQEKSNGISSQQSNGLSGHTVKTDKNKNNPDVREWDVPKLQEKVQNQSRTSEEKELAKPNETPSKGLDDFFRKTKSKPSIYWLPLTEEQILELKLAREKRNAEREEVRKREQDENNQKSYHQSPPRNEKRKHSSPSRQRHTKRR